MTHVLVLDDDMFSREALAAAIERHGYTVERAERAAPTLESLTAGNPVVAVVTDIVMPDMDGLEFIRALHRQRPDVAIVATTGNGPNAGGNYLSAARLLGAHETLAKPVRGVDLLQAIERALAAVRAEAEESLAG